MKMVIQKNRIDKKYAPIIWTCLIVASLFNALYSILAELSAYDNAKEILTYALIDILYEGFLPAVVCYCCASVVSSMAYRRGLREVPHSDFIYLTLIFTAAARLVMGFVKIFAVINPAVYVYANYICDVGILSTALYVMFLVCIYPKYLNPKSGKVYFGLWSTVYLICQGIHTLFPSIAAFVMKDDVAFAEKLQALYADYGIDLNIEVTDDMIIASIIAICLFAALLIATAVISVVLNKKAKDYVPEIPEEDDDNPFESGDFEEEKVFEEFDI